MDDRPMKFERLPAIEMAPHPPSVLLAPPVHGMACDKLLAPAPTFFAPEAALQVPPVLDELSELRLSYRRSRDGERANFNRMRPFLVIEYEALSGKGAEPKSTSRYFYVAGATASFVSMRSVFATADIEVGCSIPQCLSGPGESLRMHIFVKHRQENKIFFFRFGHPAINLFNDLVAHVYHVSHSTLSIGHGKVPTAIVRDRRGIIERISVGTERRRPFPTQNPILLKPSHMPNFPEQRVNRWQLGAYHLLIGKVLDQLARSPPGIDYPINK
jgi:hypothetical protein